MYLNRLLLVRFKKGNAKAYQDSERALPQTLKGHKYPADAISKSARRARSRSNNDAPSNKNAPGRIQRLATGGGGSDQYARTEALKI